MASSPPPTAPSPDRALSILFVCLGNLCRSPMAEGLLKRRLADAGLETGYRVRSAGTIARQDGLAPHHAVRAAAEHRVDLSTHAATPLTIGLIQQADLVVAMDRMNVEEILNLVPDLGTRLRLLNQFAPGAEGTDILDPMGLPIDAFRESYRQIVAGVDGLFQALTRVVSPSR